MSTIGSLQFLPTGLWQIPAKTSTVVPTALWESANSSDEPTNIAAKKLVFPEDDGQAVLPYSGTFEINLYCDIANDFGYTGNSTVKITYVPKNANSPGSSYVMATGNFTDGKAGTVSNYVQGNQGDMITIEWTFADALDTTVSTAPNTTLLVTDVSADLDSIYYYGVAGQPLSVGPEAEISIMQTAVVENNQAVFYTTQSGDTAGYSKFSLGIAYVDIALQATTNDTTLVPPSKWYILPYPADLKTVTIVFAEPGTPGVVWNCKCLIEGQ